MGLFDRPNQPTTRASSKLPDPVAGQLGVVVVRCSDGPMADTLSQLEECRRQGLTDITGLLEIGQVTDEDLIGLVELEMRVVFEQNGYPGDHVTIIRR